LLQIVAGVVLAQTAQPIPDAPVGQDHLDSEHQFAGIAITQHGDAAGIGRQIAADLAAALGGEAEREQPVHLGRRLMQIGKDAAGLDRHREIDRVDRADTVHPTEGEDNIVAIFRRHPAADQPGIAALRHDRQPRLGANANDGGNFLGRGGADDEPGGAMIKAASLDQIRLLVVRIGNPAGRADRVFNPLQGRREIHR